MKKKAGLGRGISALFEDNMLEEENIDEIKNKGSKVREEKEDHGYVRNIKITEIEPNKNQARKEFNEEKLEELASSIKKYGVLQPIILSKKDGYYEIIAGERRWRASVKAGLTEIPAIIKEEDEKKNATISLIENLQRENLTPIEKAKGFKDVLEKSDITVKELAKMLGLNATRVKESIQLLELDKTVIKLINQNKIPENTAKLLLQVDDKEHQKEIAKYIVEDELTFKQAKQRLGIKSKKANESKNTKQEEIEYKALEKVFSDYLKTKVRIKSNKRNKGKIEITYTSNEELERIIKYLKKD